ncbi:MAG: LamG-like jellyroll fold domain-containing protein, partial [Planctomycetota bacterium]
MSKRIQRIFVTLLVVSLCAPTAFGDLKAHYAFDDGTANDSSGNEAHAQFQGNAKVVEDTDLVPGEVFYVMEVNGGDDVLVTPGLTVQEKVPTLTFAAWIKPKEENFDGTLRSLISHKVVPWVDGTIHFMVQNRSLRFSVKFDTGLTGTVEFEADQWYHVAVVRDGTDMIAYVNGQEDTRVVGTREISFGDGFNIGAHANASRQFYGRMEDIRIYDHALTSEELLAIALAPFPSLDLAASPNPVNGETDAVRDVELSWTPGEGADQHDVYIGTTFDDVDAATTTNDPTGVYRIRQEATAYAPGLLERGQTYYWRVDEVRAVDGTANKGPVWEFTVEPFGYTLSGETIAATASSSASPNVGPENTINGSGLDDDDLHSAQTTDMWLSSSGPDAAWIQYEFDTVYRLHEMRVWNHNTSLEAVIGFGIKDATFEYSVDGANWTTLGTTHEFARASGGAGYAANTIVDLSGVAAKYVKITANSNWGGLLQYGLSEIRFLYLPVWPREPDPASGETDMDVDNVTLGWRVGREAASHDVYLGTDEQAVIDETISAVSVPAGSSYASHDTGTLDLAQTYYWKVNEVNEAETPATWQGDVSNFSTREYLVVDDFESYNDIETGEEGSNLVYATWADGFENPANGSTIGYTEIFQPSMETSIVHDGKQAVPLFYDNTTATYSEVTANVADLRVGHDWSKSGVKTLSLWFYGDPNNVAGQMYAKINGVELTYDSDADNLKRVGWQPWSADLAPLGADLANVMNLAIGFRGGGSGVVYFDDIRLYPHDRQLLTPVEPDPTNLVGHWQLDGDFNDGSDNGLNGTGMGGPTFALGKIGQAISLDGVDDYVNITGYKGILVDADDVQQPFTISCWFKTTGNGEMVTWGESSPARHRMTFRIDAGRLRTEHGDGNIQGDITCNDGQWH